MCGYSLRLILPALSVDFFYTKVVRAAHGGQGTDRYPMTTAGPSTMKCTLRQEATNASEN